MGNELMTSVCGVLYILLLFVDRYNAVPMCLFVSQFRFDIYESFDFNETQYDEHLNSQSLLHQSLHHFTNKLQAHPVCLNFTMICLNCTTI